MVKKTRSLTEWDKIDTTSSSGIRHVGRSAQPSAKDPSPNEWEDIDVKPNAPKQPVYIRLDADILEWFRGKGKGYQTHMNAVLRSYMLAQRRKENE